MNFLQAQNHVDELSGWMGFGSDQNKQDGLVIERVTRHSQVDFIVGYMITLNLRKTLKWVNLHYYPQMSGLIRGENGEVIHSYPLIR